MPDVPGTVNFPTSLDSTVSLIEAANNAATTLSVNASSSDTTLTVASTADFASSGAISIEGEVILYTGKSGTTFTGCVRGADNTVAASHTSGIAVQGLIVAAHHNTLAQAVIATQTKLGNGSGAPGSGQVLQGNGSGTSEWAALSDATTSDGGLMSAADKAKLDGATSSSTASTLIMRDANGRAQVATPSASGDIATKGYVDSQSGGGVTAVTASAGLSSTGGTTPDISITDGGVTDAKIGDRTVNQSTAMGGTPNTGSPTTLLGRFGNIIKAISGKTNWSDTPAISLESLSAHKDRHKSGGADAFTSSDLLEAVVKRLQENSGPTNLTMGSVSDGQFLKRDGSAIIGATIGTGVASGARVTRTTAQAISHNVDTAMSFNNEVFDTSNYFNSSTQPTRFTVPFTGLYTAEAGVQFPTNSSARIIIWFRVNNTTNYSQALVFGSSTTVQIPTVTSIMWLQANDYVEVFVNQNSGSSLNTMSTDNTHAAIAFLGT